MFFRLRAALGLALLVCLTTSITAFAKGNFSFLIISGPNLKEPLRTTSSVLTDDFFAFTDFSHDETEAPADPGLGFEVTRYYADVHGDIPFDHFHYYPDTGFVYYDGLVNGWSEYDGKWYLARPYIRMLFENALPDYARSAAPVAPSQPASLLGRTQSIVLTTAIAGLVVILLFASRLRKPATR